MVGINTGNETDRFVNDNLAPLGNSFAKADAGNSFWISPKITLGSQIHTASNWTLSPSAKLRYGAEWLKGFTETGPSADANAVVADRLVAFGEAKLEVSASRNFMLGDNLEGIFTARAGVSGRMSLGDDAATVTLLGITQDVPTFYEDGYAIYTALETSLHMSDAISLDLSTGGNFGAIQTNVQGAAALSVAF